MLVEAEKLHTKKPDIMRAALKLFVEKGIDGTTIREIAQEAGVGEGTLYRHFTGKEEMAWQLFYQNLMRFTQDLRQQVEKASGDCRQKIRAAVKAYFEFAEEKPLLFSYLLLGEHTELKKFPQEALRPKDILIQLVEEGKKAGTCRELDSQLAGAMLLGMILRVTTFKQEGLISARLTELVGEVAAACWRVVARE
ncbi:MAG: TetR/AcrR family transcriptional regulator [Candidatus Binatia bacterium]|jgi:AcrR family transcriptional regulator|nr:TetR/AcrR family transcriptional regulator [Candidatus Binatia bacterium]